VLNSLRFTSQVSTTRAINIVSLCRLARISCGSWLARSFQLGHLGLMLSARKAYDHRLRDLICQTRDIELAVRLGVPRATAKSWLQRGRRDVFTADLLDAGIGKLRAKVLDLV
jgi:hypothetical protein